MATFQSHLNSAVNNRVACVARRDTLALYAHISHIIWVDVDGSQIAGKVSDPDHQDVRSFAFDSAAMDQLVAVNRLWDIVA